MRLFEIFFSRNTMAAFFLLLATSATVSVPTNAYANGLNFGERKISVVSTAAQRGTQVTVAVEMDAQGDEVAASFTLSYDPLVLSNPVVSLGSGVPAGTSVTVNPDQTINGRLGIVVDSINAFASSPPSRQVVNVRFTVAADATFAPTQISFVESPTSLLVASAFGALLPAAYQVGTVTVSPTVSLVTIGGRVTTPSGQNLRSAVVTLIDSNGVRRVTSTSPFGLYSFDNVASGGTYTLTVGSKRYRFSARVETIAASVSNLDFVGLE